MTSRRRSTWTWMWAGTSVRMRRPVWPLRATAALVMILALAACARAPAPVVFHAEGAPTSLDDWHLFRIEDAHLRVNAGVEPYALNTALFSDYAHKFRTLWLPPGTRARYDAQGAFEFPVGTIISKTFYYPKAPGDAVDVVLRTDETPQETRGGIDLRRMRLIETRLLVRRASGWVAFPYVWNAGQTGATLARAGETLRLTLQYRDAPPRPFAYLVPDENQCASCHADDSKTRVLRPIGPKSRHLDRDDPWHPGERQLARLVRTGRLDRGPGKDAPHSARLDDPTASVDARARAYLDINCGHCHSAKGAADTSGLWLDAGVTDAVRLGLCKPPVAAGQGTGDRIFDIVPGQPDASILLYRMESLDPGAMMPELGRSMAHDEGVALMREWIATWPAPACREPATG